MKIHQLPLLATCLVFSLTLSAEDFTEGLLARWTFNQPGDAALLDEIHKIPLEERALPGSEVSVKVNPGGTITVGPEQFLVAPEMNSDKYPQLLKGVTIWMRMRIDSATAEHTSFLGGFFMKPRGDWKNAVLTTVHRAEGLPSPGLSFFAQVNEGEEFGLGEKVLPDHLGKFFSSALTFDGHAQTIALEVDGEKVSNKKAGAKSLVPFEFFSIGRVSPAGEAAVTIDEIRIYSSPVSSEWLADIKAVAP